MACVYGMYRDSQEKCLKHFYKVCEYMRVGTKKYLLHFQKGFLLSIRTLLCLYNDVCEYGAKYVLTARLDQDCLENFFSRIRELGHF